MNQRKNGQPQTHVANPLHCQQTRQPQPHSAGIMQPKMAMPLQTKQPVAPPVYRPQQTPNALQPKVANGAVKHNPPSAPPVYRPRSKPQIVRQKAAVASQMRTSPVAPPAYRPQPVPDVLQAKIAQATPTAAQPKANAVRLAAPAVHQHQKGAQSVQSKMESGAQVKKSPVAPPVYRPQPAPMTLQTKQAKSETAARPIINGRTPEAPTPYKPKDSHGVMQRRASQVVNPSRPASLSAKVSPGTARGTAERSPGGQVQRKVAFTPSVTNQVVQPMFLEGLGLAAAIGLGVYAYRQWNQFTHNLVEAVGRGIAFGAEEAIAEMTPFPHPVFTNRQADNFINEQQEFLDYKEKSRNLPEEYQGYICVFQREPEKFRAKVRSGQKFLWTYDTSGCLSIGSPTNNKHAIVAEGKNVYAAGIGQIKISDKEDQYMAYMDTLWKAECLKNEGKFDRVHNPYIEDAEYMRCERPASLAKTDVVVLDFDSGHYHPSDAWRKTKAAWAQAEFFVEKSTTSRRV